MPPGENELDTPRLTCQHRIAEGEIVNGEVIVERNEYDFPELKKIKIYRSVICSIL